PRRLEGAVAADRHQRVEGVSLQRVPDLRQARREHVRVQSVRPEDRPSPEQDAVDLLVVEQWYRSVVDQAGPPVLEAEDGRVVLGVCRPDQGPDDRVEARAVASRGEDTYAHVELLSVPPQCRARGTVSGGRSPDVHRYGTPWSRARPAGPPRRAGTWRRRPPGRCHRWRRSGPASARRSRRT